MFRRLQWLVVFLCSVFSVLAGADTIQLVAGQPVWQLHERAGWLEDPSGELRLDDVRAGTVAPRFKVLDKSLSSFGYTRSAWWMRVRLHHDGSLPRHMLLVLRTSWLDTIDLYTPRPDGGYAVQSYGDTLPFKVRAYANPQFVIDMQAMPGSHDYYLRLTSREAFMVPVELWTPEAFGENNRLWAAYFGMLYGILLVMLFYNALIWVATRDRNYLAYCIYLLSFGLMNASYNGFLFQYAWPDSPRWSNWAHTHFIFFYQVTSVVFAMMFLESRTRLPKLHVFMKAFLAIMLAFWLGVSVMDVPVAYNAAPVYFIGITTPLMAVVGVAALLSGYRAARFFVVASLAGMFGSFFTALTASGFTAYSFASFHAAEFGVLGDVVLLSLALADRINMFRQQRETAEQEVLLQKLHSASMLEQANEKLERTVQERTAELARARDDAERLARIDALTGVANRRYFEEVATQSCAWAQRYHQPLSTILFDIDLFKQINDKHGHDAGDLVIRAVAGVVRECVRDVDLVARIGGEEFAILLPGVGKAQALVTAERLRQTIASWKQVHGSIVLACTASFGVSEFIEDEPGFSRMLQRADQGMYAAKQAGRNSVGQPV